VPEPFRVARILKITTAANIKGTPSPEDVKLTVQKFYRCVNLLVAMLLIARYSHPVDNIWAVMIVSEDYQNCSVDRFTYGSSVAQHLQYFSVILQRILRSYLCRYRTVSEIVYDQQFSVTRFFVMWTWSFFTYVTIMEPRLLTD